MSGKHLEGALCLAQTGNHARKISGLGLQARANLFARPPLVDLEHFIGNSPHGFRSVRGRGHTVPDGGPVGQPGFRTIVHRFVKQSILRRDVVQSCRCIAGAFGPQLAGFLLFSVCAKPSAKCNMVAIWQRVGGCWQGQVQHNGGSGKSQTFPSGKSGAQRMSRICLGKLIHASASSFRQSTVKPRGIA